MSFGPKNNPELYAKVATAKNRTLCLQHQIQKLQKQQKQAVKNLQKNLPASGNYRTLELDSERSKIPLQL